MNLTEEQIKGLQECVENLYEGVWIESNNRHFGSNHSNGYDFVSIDWVNYIAEVEGDKEYDLHEFISTIDRFKVDGVNSAWIVELDFLV